MYYIISYRVLWPGGSASFTSNKGYADAGYKIYK